MNNTIFYIFLLACSVFLNGCGRSRQIPEDLAAEKESPEMIQIPENVAPEQEPPEMIDVQNLTVAGNILTLDYRVSNPFDDDIRVCHDRTVYGKQDVQHVKTRIHGETVRIILGDNVIRGGGFPNPLPVAKYVRLEPGEFYSGRVLLDLPIRDHSPELWNQRRGKERKEIALRRAVFEVDYFGSESNEHFDSVSERHKMKGTTPKLTVIGPHYYLSSSPTIIEEIVDGKLREAIYVPHSGAPRKNKESAQVIITNVAIPCSVVVEDQ
ncbi:MAG: hypothetical protein CEE38_05850 [Planctomycetes bacterium B3_Pla]|nr:MAG: hypothetical protein CEE38_05850 [Planctomycetes bacterium B3_Pla]